MPTSGGEPRRGSFQARPGPPYAPSKSPQARLNLRFDAGQVRAACLVSDPTGGFVVEEWDWRDTRPVPRRLGVGQRFPATCRPVPVGDGRVVVVQPDGARHHLHLLAGTPAATGPVVTIDAARLLVVPSHDPTVLAWLISMDADRTTLARLDDGAAMTVRPVLQVPGRLAGAGWLVPGRLLAANHVPNPITNHAAGGRSRPVSLDLLAGTVTALTTPDAGVLLTAPGAGRALVARSGPDGVRLGWLDPETDRVRCPAALNRITGEVLPLAADPDGRRLLLRLTAGVRSRLLVHDDRDDTVSEVASPPVVVRSAGWGSAGPRILYTAPGQALAAATLHRTAGGLSLRCAESSSGCERTPARDGARVEHFAGPAGPMEAVVRGPDWRTSRHVVVALHGGPEAAWDLGHHPVLDRLAAAGLAVIAPNQRGSTGYGAAYRTAIHGAWGVPDLADIRALGDLVRRGRAGHGGEEPYLYGVSYGAFLALLAAAADPLGWARCVAVAPFTSGPALHEDGSPVVRALVERLGGRVPAGDELGQRDLLRLGTRIRARLLLVHGDRDPIVPARHSRRLAAALAGTGGWLRYRELAGGGHDPLVEPAGESLLAETVAFLGGA